MCNQCRGLLIGATPKLTFIAIWNAFKFKFIIVKDVVISPSSPAPKYVSANQKSAIPNAQNDWKTDGALPTLFTKSKYR